ncbi:MAG: hypothetical protein ACOC0A_05690, partial [Planctomycetota bacterium]
MLFFGSKDKDEEENGEDAVQEEKIEETPSEGGESKGFFGRLKDGLQKTHDRITGGLRSILTVGRSLDEELIEEVEEQLYVADV